jgi:hypothetical protein
MFISTHSQDLHHATCEELARRGYRVEISSDFEFETTSYDGLVFASNPDIAAVFPGFTPLGRLQIVSSQPAELAAFIGTVTIHP